MVIACFAQMSATTLSTQDMLIKNFSMVVFQKRVCTGGFSLLTLGTLNLLLIPSIVRSWSYLGHDKSANSALQARLQKARGVSDFTLAYYRILHVISQLLQERLKAFSRPCLCAHTSALVCRAGDFR